MQSISYKTLKKLLLVSTISFIIQVIPLLFIPFRPWSGDTISNEYPAVQVLDSGHIPLVRIFRSPIPIIASRIVSDILSLDTAIVLSFYPLFLFSVGTIILGIMASKYLKDENMGVWSAGAFGLFGPTIYWASQGVRESFALAFIPWVFWAIYEYNTRKSKVAILGVIFTIFILIITHHWSSLMALLILTPILTISAFRGNLNAFYSGVIYLCLFFTYWIEGYEFIPHLISKALAVSLSNFLIGSSTGGAGSILVFERPPQMFLSIVVIALLAGLGVLTATLNRVYRVSIVVSSTIMLVIVVAVGTLLGGNFVAFDPLRTIEFLGFPASIAVGYFVGSLKKEYSTKLTTYLEIVLLLVLVISAMLFYPVPYYTGEQVNESSWSYDIRGDKFFATYQDKQAIEFVDEYGSDITAPGITILNEQSKYIYETEGPCSVWLTGSTKRIAKAQQSIVAKKFKMDKQSVPTSQDNSVIYHNGYGQLYHLEDKNSCKF